MKKEGMITEELLGLISGRKFAALNTAEQDSVLTQLSPQEYDELHEAYASAQVGLGADRELRAPVNVKRTLDQAFQKAYPKKVPIFARPVVVWKAAAIFLLLFGTSFICLKRSLKETQTVALMVRDTIFVKQPVELIKRLTDTVIEYRDAAVKEKKRSLARTVPADFMARQDSNRIREIEGEGIGIRTLQAGDLLKELNSNGGRTMKEDELVQQFSFTKI
ncbi:MAG TPA: hypothetical protein VL092_13145 [Chitinophagaceae bacterium]|nr:hypothetical protein [Chitinophagaceae bacterium]